MAAVPFPEYGIDIFIGEGMGYADFCRQYITLLSKEIIPVYRVPHACNPNSSSYIMQYAANKGGLPVQAWTILRY
jgi:hypothetical protein